MPLDGCPLVLRQVLRHEPGAPPDAEQVGMRTLRQQVGVQDGLRDCLEPYTLPHDLLPPRDLAPERQGLWIRQPNVGQEAAGIEPGQHSRVDHVGLDLNMRDHPHLAWVGDDHAAEMRRHHLHHGRCVARGLHDHMVVVRQRPGERLKVVARHANTAEPDEPAAVQHHGLGEHAVYVHSHDSHRPASIASRLISREPAGNTATTDPRSRRTRASRRGGQKKARAHSPGSCVGLPALACSRRPMARMGSP